MVRSADLLDHGRNSVAIVVLASSLQRPRGRLEACTTTSAAIGYFNRFRIAVQTVSNTLMRAWSLQLDSTTVHGANGVLVR